MFSSRSRPPKFYLEQKRKLCIEEDEERVRTVQYMHNNKINCLHEREKERDKCWRSLQTLRLWLHKSTVVKCKSKCEVFGYVECIVLYFGDNKPVVSFQQYFRPRFSFLLFYTLLVFTAAYYTLAGTGNGDNKNNSNGICIALSIYTHFLEFARVGTWEKRKLVRKV